MAGRKDECFVDVLRVMKDIMHALKVFRLYMPFRTSGVHWTPCPGEWFKKEKNRTSMARTAKVPFRTLRSCGLSGLTPRLSKGASWANWAILALR